MIDPIDQIEVFPFQVIYFLREMSTFSIFLYYICLSQLRFKFFLFLQLIFLENVKHLPLFEYKKYLLDNF